MKTTTSILALLLLATPASSQTPLDGGPAPRVVMWEDYCSREGSEDPVCTPGSTITGDKATFALVRKINAKVNKIPYKTDKRQFGVEEFWSSDPSLPSVDCDDSVLIKRRLLMEAGVSPGELFPAICTTGLTVGHIVLLVRRGDNLLVLDSENPDIEKFSERGLKSGCEWHSWLDPHSGEWRAFGR